MHDPESNLSYENIYCMNVDYQEDIRMLSRKLWPRLHYTGLHRSVAIFIPDSAAV
jgi:hypothetical protein